MIQASHALASGGLRSADVPVIVAGMHRSGTSLVASFLVAFGVDMGDELVAGDRHNPLGYFEDVHFLECQRRMLQAATRPDDGGHRDWGWTESESFDAGAFEAFRDEAHAVVTRRRARNQLWGWKDPRTTLLLDFWQDILDPPGARYVLLYRHPWDVADSMQRLGAEVFLRNPEYAYRIWTYYNRRLLDFYQRHRDRSVLVSTETVLDQPERFVALLRSKLGLDLTDESPSQVKGTSGLFARLDATDPLIGLVSLTVPSCTALLRDLDREADLAAPARWTANPPDGARVGAASIGLSVITPCHNDAPFLIEAVASVERCAPGAELLIVNDGSDEARTLEILDLLRGAGYRVLDQSHQGLPVARNRGIAEAAGPYILPLDADNRLRARFASEAIAILEGNPSVGVVHGDRCEFGLRSGVAVQGDLDIDRLLVGNYIDACAIFRKSVWSELGGYDTGLEALEDWEFWIAAADLGWEFHHWPGPAFDYRVRPGSLTDHAHANHRELMARIIGKHAFLVAGRLTALTELARGRTDGDPLARTLADMQEGAGSVQRRPADALARARLALDWAHAEHTRLRTEQEQAQRATSEVQAELIRVQAELDKVVWSRTWRWSRRLRAFYELLLAAIGG